MPDIYDSLLDQEQAQQPEQPAAPSIDIYDSILDAERKSAQQAMQPVLDMATKITPDRASSVQKLSKSMGLPTELVERNFDELQRREQMRNMQNVLAKSPVLSRQMMNPEFAALAQEDLEPLSGIEGAFTVVKNLGKASVSGLYGASAGVVGLGQSGAELLQFATKPLAGRVLPVDVGGMIANNLSSYRQGIEAEAESWMPQSSGIISGGVYSGMASLGRNLASLPLLFFPGGQQAALLGMTLPVGGEEYGKARDAGLGVGPALGFGMSQAVIEWATEQIPVTKLLGDLKAGASLPRMIANQLIAEIPGEQVATILQDLNEWAAIDSNNGKTFRDYLSERPSAAAQTLIATIVGTAGQTTVMKGIETVANRVSSKGKDAQQAQLMNEQIGRVVQFARAAKIAERDPETFQQFVEQYTEDGPLQDVYIDANVLMQSGLAEPLAAVSPSVAEQINEAAELGIPVRIPVSEFAARIAPTEMTEQLLDHLKTTPDGMTRVEAAQYIENQVEELGRALGEQMAETDTQMEFRASVESVRNVVAEELNAAGRFSPDVNQAYGALVGEFFGSLAQRTDRTAQELFEEYRLRTVAQSVDGGLVLDQGEIGQTGEIDEATGLPLNEDGTVTVYHHTSAENAERIRKDGMLRSAGEPDLYFTTRAETDTGYGDTAIAVRVRPDRLQLDDEFDDGRQDYRVEAPSRGRRLKFLPDGSALLNQAGQNVGQPLDTVRTAWRDAGIDFELMERGDVVTVSKIVVPEGAREAGAGTRAMEQLVAWADANGKHLALTPSADFGGNKKRLTAFYKRFGFKENKGKSRVFSVAEGMVREAKNGPALYQFAGPQAATADTMALDTAKARIEAGEDAETVRQATGWFKGADGKWRFEISDADAKLRPALRSLKDGGYDAKQIASVTYRKRDDGTYDVTLNPPNPQQTSDFVMLTGISDAALRAVLPEDSVAAIERNDGADDFVGDFEEARRIDAAFEFEGFNALPLDDVLDHPSLFTAYPALRDVMVQVDPKIGVGGSFAYVDHRDGTTSQVIRVGNGQQLSTLLHEIQHGIQSIEGFARGGVSDGVYRGTQRDEYIADEIERRRKNHAEALASVDPEGKTAEILSRVTDADLVQQAVSYVDGPAGRRNFYRRLAGEVEARNTQSRQRMTDAERRATPPSATADVADADVIVVFNGTEMASAPTPANAAPRSTANRGGFNPATNTIALLQAADLSTFLHESGHFFLEVMTDMAGRLQQMRPDELTEGERGIVRDMQAVMSWFGVSDLNQWAALDFEEKRAYHEKFAESFEVYLMEGRAPSIELQPMFQRFRAWLLNVYQSIKDFVARNPDAGELSDEVRGVFDRMLATDDAIENAARGRSMMPLFENAEQAGMTEDEFAEYQAIGQDATDSAKDELGARAVRDMQWLSGARSRALKRLQAEAKALRDEAEIEARREVMSQPVYRAWQWLAGKMEERIGPAQRRKSDPNVVDPSVDNLFVAIAKLGGIDRAELEAQWGLDPKEKIAQQGFGKHVLRRNGGRGIDDMRAALVQYGYLDESESGPDWNPREFEDKFFDQLGGSEVFSNAADFDALTQGDRPGDQIANPAALPAARLDRAALADTSLTEEQKELLRTRRMVARDGLHPDIVAELFGFDSGDALVQSLAAAQDPQEQISAMADSIMLQRHGDLATPEAMQRAADASIYNNVRARLVAAELNALNRATGPRQALTKAAREFANRMISRLKVRNVKPSQYASADVRAGKAAEAALKSGDRQQAAAEKRNQLINTQATRAAHEALREIEMGLRYLKKFDRDGTRKAIDADYLEQIDAMLERFDLRKGQSLKAIDKRTALAKWIEARAEEGTEPDIPEWLQLESAREHYKNLTVEQFRGLVDSVRQIEHLGRLKNKLLTARDARALDAIVDEISASMEEASGGRTIDNERRATLGSKATHMARGFMAMHRQLHSLAREMDGYRDGGPLWDALIRPMNEAGEREASMRAEASRALHALAKPLLNDGQKMGGKGVFFPSMGRSLNRGERIAIALNWGNEGNRQRLLDGRRWTAAQVEPVLKSLSSAELQFVQGVWDFFESYRPLVAEKEKRLTGKEPDWVDPAPFQITSVDGVTLSMRGGYYPIKYDPNQSGDAERQDQAEEARQMLRAANTAATTRRSYTKSRSEKVVGRPILLTFDGIYRGANEVIHDLAWHEWLVDANKLMRKLDAPMREHFGAQNVQAFKKAIKDIAQGDQPAANEFERWLGHLRNGSTIAGLGWNLRTALLQPLGLTNSLVRVGPEWVARGLREFYGSPKHMAAKVAEAQEKSEFLRNRMRTMNREINDIQNRLDGGKGDVRTAIEASFFILIQKTQALVDYPTWYGAYEKAMADPALMNEDGTIDEAKAVAMADQAVIAAQSGGQVKDLAQIQRGGPLQKLFTNFYSYFASTLQLIVERTGQTNFRKPHEVLRLAGDYILLMVVPTIGSVLLNALMKGAPEDEDEWVEQIIEEQISFLFGLTPFTREMTSAVQAATGYGGQFGYSGPAGLRFFAEVYRLGQQAGQGEFDMALFKAANNTAGVLFHYPAGQVNRTVAGTAALIDGETSNPFAVISGPPVNR